MHSFFSISILFIILLQTLPRTKAAANKISKANGTSQYYPVPANARIFCTDEEVEIKGLTTYNNNEKELIISGDRLKFNAKLHIRRDGSPRVMYFNYSCGTMCDPLTEASSSSNLDRFRFSDFMLEKVYKSPNFTMFGFYLLPDNLNLKSPQLVSTLSIVKNKTSSKIECQLLAMSPQLNKVFYVLHFAQIIRDIICSKAMQPYFIDRRRVTIVTHDPNRSMSLPTKSSNQQIRMMFWDVINGTATVANVRLNYAAQNVSDVSLTTETIRYTSGPNNGYSRISLEALHPAYLFGDQRDYLLVLGKTNGTYFSVGKNELQLISPFLYQPVQLFLGCPQPFCLSAVLDDLMLVRHCEMTNRLNTQISKLTNNSKNHKTNDAKPVQNLLLILRGQYMHMVDMDKPKYPLVDEALPLVDFFGQMNDSKIVADQLQYFDAAEYINELELAVLFKDDSFIIMNQFRFTSTGFKLIYNEFSDGPSHFVEAAIYFDGYLHLFKERQMWRYKWSSYADEKDRDVSMTEYLTPAPYQDAELKLPRILDGGFSRKGILYLFQSGFFYTYKGYTLQKGPQQANVHFFKGCEKVIGWKGNATKNVPSLPGLSNFRSGFSKQKSEAAGNEKKAAKSGVMHLQALSIITLIGLTIFELFLHHI